MQLFQEFRGYFIKVLKESIYDAGTFIIVSNNQIYKVLGYTPFLKKNTPIIVYGTLNETNNTITMADIMLNTEEKVFKKYFSGPMFKGIGDSKVQKIYDALNFATKDEDITTIPRLDLIEILKDQQVNNLIIDLFCDKFYEINIRRYLLKTLLPYHASYRDVEKLYTEHKGNVLKQLKKNPYQNRKLGISFTLCDSIACSQELKPYNDKRLSAITYEIANYIKQTGSSCVNKETLLQIFRRVEKRGAYGYLPLSLVLATILKSDIKTLKIENETAYYQANTYNLEESITKEINRLQTSSEVMDFDMDEYKDHKMLDEDQLSAISKLTKTGIKVITGGPGSGKTTIIKEFIDIYKKIHPEHSIYLTAPTGRAAQRISESSGFTATTIHKLLGFKPFNNQLEIKYNRKNQLDKGIFIVDEMSMVGEDLFEKLIQAIPNGSLVILCGDPRQLQSVEPGNVLQDIIKSEAVPTTHLTHIHRQTGDSTIIENYYKIKDFKTDLIQNKDFKILKFSDQNKMIDKIMELYDENKETGELMKQSPYNFQILSFTKKNALGKNNINNLIYAKRSKIYHKTSKLGFLVGDKIMMTRNNYEEGYLNGDIGIITFIDEENEVIEANFYDGIRELNKEALYDTDHAWCCTVHKSQGSEYDTVVVVIDNSFSNMLYNSIILTAITRAKKKVIVLSMNDSLEQSITKNNNIDRTTGLWYMLKERNEDND